MEPMIAYLTASLHAFLLLKGAGMLRIKSVESEAFRSFIVRLESGTTLRVTVEALSPPTQDETF